VHSCDVTWGTESVPTGHGNFRVGLKLRGRYLERFHRACSENEVKGLCFGNSR
jgi:hypothetical protein